MKNPAPLAAFAMTVFATAYADSSTTNDVVTITGGTGTLSARGSGTSKTTNNSSAQGLATQATYASFASATDLIQSGSSTLTSALMDKTPNTAVPGGTGALNDGSVPNTGNGCFLPATFGSTAKMPFTYTVTLNTSVNTLGYDISGINTFASWSQNGAFLANQKFQLLVMTVSGGTFLDYGTFAYTPTAFALTTEQTGATMVNITGQSGLIASGVSALRFVFQDHGVSNSISTVNGTVYQEVDVIGSATAVPEPSTYGLMGAGALAVALIRRRLRRNV